MNVTDYLAIDPACDTPLSPLRFIECGKRYFRARLHRMSGYWQFIWRAIASRSVRLALALRRCGVRLGDPTLVFAPNGAGIVEAHFGEPVSGSARNYINVRPEPLKNCRLTAAHILRLSKSSEHDFPTSPRATLKKSRSSCLRQKYEQPVA